MSRKKTRPLPPRTLRMKRDGRLQSARTWLAAQRGRPAERIARSYRKRYGVDWECAVTELSKLGLVFDPKWREALARSLETARAAKVRRKAEKAAAAKRVAYLDSDAKFAYVAGYPEGGAPYGTPWEELMRQECDAPTKPTPDRESRPMQVDDSLPF